MRPRFAFPAIALALLVGLAGVVLAARAWPPRDGSPDDRVLATMQDIAWDAQTALDETGDLPDVPDSSESIVAYERIGRSGIRLCGNFQRASFGQAVAHPFFDVVVRLQRELARPHAAGLHCYDIALETTAPEVRQDALLFRQMNAAATAAECAFTATARLPPTIAEAKALSQQQRHDPACHIPALPPDHQDIDYAPLGDASIRLCADFRRGYASGQPARLFDPARDARFAELAQARSELGRRCYAIRMAVPDPAAEIPGSTWDEPLEVEQLPAAIRGAAAQDKRAIGDAVNVLRLARCAFTLGGAAPSTIEDAIRTIAASPRVAERRHCDWAPHYFAVADNSPVASYESTGDGRVRVCAHFRRAWERPLALNYYGQALADWPMSLAELQRPISEPSRHCFSTRLTAIGSGAV